MKAVALMNNELGLSLDLTSTHCAGHACNLPIR